MSDLLVITNGQLSIQLRPCTPLPTAANPKLLMIFDGNRQKVAARNPSGDYDRVTESYEVVFRDTTDDKRAPELINLGLIRELVIHRQESTNILSEWVWLEVRTPTEANTRYALVWDVFVPELDARHWRGSDSLPRMTIFVERDGLWRENAPSDGMENLLVNGLTVYNHWIGAETNRAHINAALVEGDAHALTKISTTETQPASQNNVIIGMKHGYDLAALQRFVAHFNAVDEALNPLLHQVDASAPGGERIELTGFLGASQFAQLRWLLPVGSTINDYDDVFQIYAVAWADVENVVKLRFNGTDTIGDYVTVPDGSVNGPAQVFLGQFKLPATQLIPGLSSNSYLIQVDCLIEANTPAATLFLYNIFLVPVGSFVGGLRTLRDGAPPGFDVTGVSDGDLMQSYFLVNGNQDLSYKTEVIGQFIQLPPEQHTMLYFYWSRSFLTAGNTVYTGVSHTKTASIDIESVNRYQTLRD